MEGRNRNILVQRYHLTTLLTDKFCLKIATILFPRIKFRNGRISLAVHTSSCLDRLGKILATWRMSCEESGMTYVIWRARNDACHVKSQAWRISCEESGMTYVMWRWRHDVCYMKCRAWRMSCLRARHDVFHVKRQAWHISCEEWGMTYVMWRWRHDVCHVKCQAWRMSCKESGTTYVM
jgi:hypothetical protein